MFVGKMKPNIENTIHKKLKLGGGQAYDSPNG
jgi:hypothetical protein